MNELELYISSYFDTRQELTEKLAKLFVAERLERNAFHTQLGSRQGKLSFVRSGYLRIYKQTDKKEVTQWISSPGEFTTDLNPILFDLPARWNIQALSDCELYSLDDRAYARIAEEIPEWPVIEKLFMGKCFMSIEDRVFGFLSLSAEERYLLLHEHKRDLFKHIPMHYLASMLGMTPETFSRVRKKIVS